MGPTHVPTCLQGPGLARLLPAASLTSALRAFVRYLDRDGPLARVRIAVTLVWVLVLACDLV